MVIHYAADYFPYGKILRSYAPCTFSTPRYQTTHHERDAATGYDNRGARLYDAEIARFLGVDPLAQEFAAWSGYNYVLGNPVGLVDPDGKAPASPDDWVKTSSGAIVYDAKVIDKASAQDRYGTSATYLGESAVIMGSNGTQISLNANGRATEASFLPIVSVTSSREGGALATADNVATTTGLAADMTDAGSGLAASLTGNAGDYSKGLDDIGKGTGALGKAAGGVGIINSANDLSGNPSVGNTLKLVFDIVVTGAKMHPVGGIITGIIDMSGAKDGAAKTINRVEENLSYESWLDSQTINIKN